MSKKNKEIHHLNYLFNKASKILYAIGVKTINTPLEKVFLKTLSKIDTNLYLMYSDRYTNVAIGYRTFYCSVTTYVPAELKNYWVSDHHVLTLFYKLGNRNICLIPYKGDLYTINFNRSGLSSNDMRASARTLQQYLNENFILFNNFSEWIDLFYFNNCQNIVRRQGVSYFELTKINKDFIQDIVRNYQYSCDISYVSDARQKMIKVFEKVLSSIAI